MVGAPMASNVEIKARVPDLEPIRAKAAKLASGPAQLIEQTDTFFVVPRGRLKVREFADGTGELIAYERPDQEGPTQSTFTRAACPDARALSQALSDVLSVRGVVKKRREVFIVGRTRVHLDQVEHLGCFVELEAVLQPGEDVEQGDRDIRGLLEALEIPETALVAPAYIDLLGSAPA
jgi:predicted adenylyl cyclase CyaB